MRGREKDSALRSNKAPAMIHHAASEPFLSLSDGQTAQHYLERYRDLVTLSMLPRVRGGHGRCGES
jgi:hypothetical protein